MKNDISAPISRFESNNHVEKKVNENITVLRTVKASEHLDQGCYYARQIEAETLAGGSKLETLGGRVMIAKQFPHVAKLMGNTVVIVQVKNPQECCIF